MIKIFIFCSLALQFGTMLTMELSKLSATIQTEFSGKQWQLPIRTATCRQDSPQADEASENPLEALFPEINPPHERSTVIPSSEEDTYKTKKETGNRYQKCPECGKTVSKISAHLRYHKDEFNYPCDYCDKTFKESCNRNRHQRICKNKPNENPEIMTALPAAMIPKLKKRRKAKPNAEKDPKALPNNSIRLGFRVKEYTPSQPPEALISHFHLWEEQMDTANPQPEDAEALDPSSILDFKIKEHAPTESSTGTATHLQFKGKQTEATESCEKKDLIVLGNSSKIGFKANKYTPSQSIAAITTLLSLGEKQMSIVKPLPKKDPAALRKRLRLAAKIKKNAHTQPSKTKGLHLLLAQKQMDDKAIEDKSPRVEHSALTQQPKIKKRGETFAYNLREKKYDQI